MADIRILLFNCVSLLALGVETMLSSRNGLNYQTLSRLPEDEIELMEVVFEYRPDMIILGGCANDVERKKVIDLMVNLPSILVISISQDNNWLQVYSKNDYLLTQASDLIGLINSM